MQKALAKFEVKKAIPPKRTLLGGSQDDWEETNQPDVMKPTLRKPPPPSSPTENSRPKKRRLLESQYDDERYTIPRKSDQILSSVCSSVSFNDYGRN